MEAVPRRRFSLLHISNAAVYAYYRIGAWLTTRPVITTLFTAVLFADPGAAHANTCGTADSMFSGITNTLGSMASFLTGPVARSAVIIAIAITGLILAFGELKGIFGTLVKIVMGASLALFAGQWLGIFGVQNDTTVCSTISGGLSGTLY